MLKRIVLPLAFAVALPGCASNLKTDMRADLYQTLDSGARAVEGQQTAFDRLQALRERWAGQGAGEDAAAVTAGVDRILAARDAVLSQRELTDVMMSAIKDIETEYDTVVDALGEDETPGAGIPAAAAQKYLARRMAWSIATMTRADMVDAVEAADVFARDVTQFQRALEASMNGDEAQGIEPSDNPGVQDSLSQIEELFSGYIAESSEGVLDNVVSQYDAWLALQDLRALADAKYAPSAKAGEPVTP